MNKGKKERKKLGRMKTDKYTKGTMKGYTG
jgi:hypothetical protein